MTEYLGRPLIEDGASPLEQVLADVEAEQLLSIEAELIAANWDPFKVQERNLIYLAFGMGVTLWDDRWPVEIKRYWLSIQWQWKALRGTQDAFRIALGLWGYTLVDVLHPPQGFYASRDLTPDERNEWLRRMPQLRIRLEAQHGYGHPDEWFAGDGFAGYSFAGVDDAPLLLGRRGFIRKDGVDYPLQSEVLTTSTVNGNIITVERISTPGYSSLGFFAGVDFAGDDRFAGAAEVEAELITVRKDEDYQRTNFLYGLTSIIPTLDPIDVRYERQSDTGNGGEFYYAGDFAGTNYTAYDNAADMIYDVMYLFDRKIAGPMTEGGGFAGVDRAGIPQKTAEMMIDLHEKAGPYEFFAGESFVLEGFATPDDDTARVNAMNAVLAAKAERDTVLVSFAPRRPLEFRDDIQEDTPSNLWVRDLL